MSFQVTIIKPVVDNFNADDFLIRIIVMPAMSSKESGHSFMGAFSSVVMDGLIQVRRVLVIKSLMLPCNTAEGKVGSLHSFYKGRRELGGDNLF